MATTREHEGAGSERESQRINALKSRSDWKVFDDVYLLPYSVKVSPSLMENVRQWNRFDSDDDEHLLRAIARTVREKLFPAWLARRESIVVPLQLDFTPKPEQASRGVPTSWHFIGLPGVFFLCEQPVLPYEEYALPLSNGVRHYDEIVDGPLRRNHDGEPMSAFWSHTDNHKAFYAPVFDRGDAPPVEVDDLKAELEEMVANGTDIMLTYYVSGPETNLRIEVSDYDKPDEKHIQMFLDQLEVSGANKVVMIGEIWFCDDDGNATWDGIQIIDSRRGHAPATYTAPFEGKRKLGEWQKLETDSKRARVGRNDLCPCGSGMKYKKCCMGKADR